MAGVELLKQIQSKKPPAQSAELGTFMQYVWRRIVDFVSTSNPAYVEGQTVDDKIEKYLHGKPALDHMYTQMVQSADDASLDDIKWLGAFKH
eukprot:1832940-Amphidinium_carterae.1